MLFKEQPDFVWGLIASMYTGNIIGVLIVLAFVPFFAAILRLPFAILTPFIVVICGIGAYAVHNNMIDIWYMVIFGVIGYVFKKLNYPLAPLVLALVLGDFAESALRQSLIISQGSLLIFFQRPIAAVITAVAIFFLVLPAITLFRHKRALARAGAVPPSGSRGLTSLTEAPAHSSSSTKP
jgi:putative tricarboxylic transport membrane protein